MHFAQLIHPLYAPLSSLISSHISTRCLSEKCYEATHLRRYDTGESWGRIHLRNVEQCTCEAGEISCQRVHYTSKMCFLPLSPCLQRVPFVLRRLLFVGLLRSETQDGSVRWPKQCFLSGDLQLWLCLHWSLRRQTYRKNSLNKRLRCMKRITFPLVLKKMFFFFLFFKQSPQQ